MKKFLSLVLLMSGFAMLHAQSPLGVTYMGTTYNDGDTVTVRIARDADECNALGIVNQGNNRIEGIIISLEEVSRNGIEVWAMCTGDVCIPGLTSNPIDLAPRASYSNLTLDIRTDATVQNGMSVYTMRVGTPDIYSTVVVRFAFNDVGIEQVVAFASLLAFPNPSENHATIYYSTVRPAELVIYDVLGNLRHSQRVDGTGTLRLGLGCGTPTLELGTGIYFYGLVADETCRVMKKLVIR